jgi:hypothetical protein
VGGTTGAIDGEGSAGILAALPMPLGSRIEPFCPFTFPGPGGMPLTPASWAGDREGTATRHMSARLTNANLPIIHRREKTETACVIDLILSRAVSFHGKNVEGASEVPIV